MAERQLPKLHTRVRFPSPAPPPVKCAGARIRVGGRCNLRGMNKDQLKGAAKIIVGKAQEEAGNLTGNADQVSEGLKNQITGKLQKGLGDVKETIKEFQKDHPKPE